MSFTVQDALLSVAYRLGYDSVPSDANEKARWISQCDDAQRSIIRKNYYWFTQDTKSLTTIEDQERYDLDATFRQMIEARLNGTRVEPITLHEANVSYNIPFTGVPITPNSARFALSYYLFGERELHILPSPGAAPSTLSVSGITRSGSTVTVTTSTEHGYSVNDFVTIAGADQSDYNGAQRIYSVPSSTTFTFITTATPVTPATGTITCTERNFVYSFYKLPSRITALTDTLLIPDLFFEAFVAYVKARIDLRDSERGAAADSFDEFNELINDLDIEHSKRTWSNVNILMY